MIPSFVVTRRLWRQLWHPPRQHPLFRQTSHRSSAMRFRTVQIVFVILGLLAALALLVVAPMAALALALMLVVVFPLGVLLVNGTVYGLYWSGGIAAALAAERQRGRYDLLRLTPTGNLGVGWFISTGILHRGGLLRQVHLLVRGVTVLFLAALIISGLVLLLALVGGSRDPFGEAPGFRSVTPFIPSIVLVLALYLDHFYATILCLLVGNWVPLRFGGSLDARAAAMAVFALLQVLCYVLGILAVLVGVVLARAANWPDTQTQVIAAGVGFVMFVALREAVNWLVWRALLNQSDATTVDWQQATG